MTIRDAAWLAGRWTGEGLGGRLDEGRPDPVGGRMAGYFTLSRDSRPAFHEMLRMEGREGGLRLRGSDGLAREEVLRYRRNP